MKKGRASKKDRKQKRRIRERARQAGNTMNLDKYREGLEALSFASSLEGLHSRDLIHVETNKKLIDAALDGEQLHIHVNVRAALEFFETLEPFWVKNEPKAMESSGSRTSWIVLHFLAHEQGGTGRVSLGKDDIELKTALAILQLYDLDNPVTDPEHPEILWFHPSEKERARLQRMYDYQRADPSSPYFEGEVKRD